MADKIDTDSVSGTATTGHEWDGIRELDTPLPSWWIYTFYVTIAFAIVWCLLYPPLPWFGGLLGHTERSELTKTMARVGTAQKPFLDRIVAMPLDEVRKDTQLAAFARAGGRAAFANNCEPCHRAGGAGSRGYPNLADDDWLWGGRLQDIEQSIRYGIRSDHDKTRVSPMPRFGADGTLTPAQIEDVVEFVLSLSGAKHEAGAAARGATVYAEHCVSCHMPGGRGNPEIGAPALNDTIWLYSGDRATIRAMVTAPRLGSMPAWEGRLDEATIRMLAFYVHGLGGGK